MTSLLISAFVIIFLFVCILILVVRFVSDVISDLHNTPYLDTPDEVVNRLLELAQIDSSDVVLDLGCGDGRFLLTAVSDFDVKRAVGYEIAPWPFIKAWWGVLRYGNKIKIYRKNLFVAELGEATVIIVYLKQELLAELRAKFQKELRPGARVISVRFSIPGWKEKICDRTTKFPIYFYTQCQPKYKTV